MGVGMLAAAGFLVQENFHPLFTADGGPAIEQIPSLPPALWFVMTLGIGICESLRIQRGWANPYESMDNVQALKPDYYPGDLGFDPLGLKPDDPAEFRRMQERELSHGRLAMLAAAGFIAQEAVTGKTWGGKANFVLNDRDCVDTLGMRERDVSHASGELISAICPICQGTACEDQLRMVGHASMLSQ